MILVQGFRMDKVTCESAEVIYELKGNTKLRGYRECESGEVKKFVKKVSHVDNVVEKNVTDESAGPIGGSL